MTTSRPKIRMTGTERREQLIGVGRRVFAERGVADATVEEIAAAAGVTKPVVYEHFGGKEGLYAVVVDRETRALLDTIADAITEDMSPREFFERATVAELHYISTRPDGFRVLIRDAPSWHSTGPLSSLMSDLATQIETYLARVMRRREIDERFAPIYAQMFVGMVALTGDWWLEHGHEFTAEEIAAHMVNLGWNGLTGLEASPRLETTAIDATAPPRGNSSLVTRLDDAADGVPPADA
ncbi:TetR/AcrR family transcriptional regulator [Dermacoccus abyssi]|uniref:TetR/AcrR family transcriptional regulator n=1 Tax=Dermacoccus sp. PAMC28757 TaxID=2762331 RepID=UPI002107326F|nr:TetR/AcrR family transcriptional regulator [Dermacoccus sp. PAMC28757]